MERCTTGLRRILKPSLGLLFGIAAAFPVNLAAQELSAEPTLAEQLLLVGHGRRCRCHPPCPTGRPCPRGQVLDDEPTGDADYGESGAEEAAPEDAMSDAAPDEESAILDVPEPSRDVLASSYGRPRGPDSFAPNMMGDFLPGGAFNATIFLSADSINREGRIFIPYGDPNEGVAIPQAHHLLKTAESDSPWPRDRVYFVSQYYEGVPGADSITKQQFGWERRILDGQGSIGLRLPFFTVDPGVQVDSRFAGGRIGTFGAGTNDQADVGDLSILLKYAVLADRRGGNVGTLGLVVTAPTGPDTIADVDPLFELEGVEHDGTIQPYLAFYRSFDRSGKGWFLQGFSAVDVPFDSDDATLLFNDIGIGCIFPRSPRRGLTAIVPTLEIHSNTVLNNREHGVVGTRRFAELTVTNDLPSGFDRILGSVEFHDQLSLTSGVSFVFNRRSTLALGVVTPVTGPNPFDYELQAQLSLLQW